MEDKTSISFKKKYVINQFKQNDRLIDVITFPNQSNFKDYVWFWPHEWITQSQFDEEKVYISMNTDADVKIQLKEENEGHFKVLDEKIIKPERLKLEMIEPLRKPLKKRPVITFKK